MDVLAPFTTRYAPNGMVCSVDHLASGAGVDVMRAGGSAVDAAIATSAVLAVTTQHLCGMGGDLFAIVHTGGSDPPVVLNASGRAGSGADPDRLRAQGHTRVPATGNIAAVPVPGCVDGWLALHERFGRLPLGEVLEPARRYAADGFPAAELLARSAARLFALDLPEAADYTGGRTRLRTGDIVRRPGVARALAAIATSGRDGFYGGEFGEALIATGGGEYTTDDLRAPLADWVPPLGVDAWHRRIWTVPPNSQGYLTLASAWIAQEVGIGDERDDEWVHLLVESVRAAGFDRPDVLHEAADGGALIAPERLRPRAAAIRRDRAAALGDRYGGGGTIFLAAADARDGMAVSLIQSNYTGFGSMIIVPGTRIFLQNRGAGFNLTPGHPAEYGPGRRPPHTLAPALVTALDGTFDSIVGTMGADSQPQVILQLLARRFGPGTPDDLAAALAAPRFALAGDRPGHDVWEPASEVAVALDQHAPGSWAEGLERRGHRVISLPAWSSGTGHAHMIAALPGGGLAGAADPRALSGSAAGF